jgi:hypothetical protein
MPGFDAKGADQSLDDCKMSDAESFHAGFHPRTRNVPTFTSPVDASLEDEMASSDDGDGDGNGDGNDDGNDDIDENYPRHSEAQVVDKGQNNPQVSNRLRKVRPDGDQVRAVY